MIEVDNTLDDPNNKVFKTKNNVVDKQHDILRRIFKSQANMMVLNESYN